jgi:hypothetical protein
MGCASLGNIWQGLLILGRVSNDIFHFTSINPAILHNHWTACIGCGFSFSLLSTLLAKLIHITWLWGGEACYTTRFRNHYRMSSRESTEGPGTFSDQASKSKRHNTRKSNSLTGQIQISLSFISGADCLQFAIESGSTALVNFLVDNGADVNLAFGVNQT